LAEAGTGYPVVSDSSSVHRTSIADRKYADVVDGLKADVISRESCERVLSINAVCNYHRRLLLFVVFLNSNDSRPVQLRHRTRHLSSAHANTKLSIPVVAIPVADTVPAVKPG